MQYAAASPASRSRTPSPAGAPRSAHSNRLSGSPDSNHHAATEATYGTRSRLGARALDFHESSPHGTRDALLETRLPCNPCKCGSFDCVACSCLPSRRASDAASVAASDATAAGSPSTPSPSAKRFYPCRPPPLPYMGPLPQTWAAAIAAGHGAAGPVPSRPSGEADDPAKGMSHSDSEPHTHVNGTRRCPPSDVPATDAGARSGPSAVMNATATAAVLPSERNAAMRASPASGQGATACAPSSDSTAAAAAGSSRALGVPSKAASPIPEYNAGQLDTLGPQPGVHGLHSDQRSTAADSCKAAASTARAGCGEESNTTAPTPVQPLTTPYEAKKQPVASKRRKGRERRYEHHLFGRAILRALRAGYSVEKPEVYQWYVLLWHHRHALYMGHPMFRTSNCWRYGVAGVSKRTQALLDVLQKRGMAASGEEPEVLSLFWRSFRRIEPLAAEALAVHAADLQSAHTAEVANRCIRDWSQLLSACDVLDRHGTVTQSGTLARGASRGADGGFAPA